MEELIKYKTEFPKKWTFLWSPEEAEQIPNEHKDQIHFLNEEGTEFVKKYLNCSKMLGPNNDPKWNPFYKNYFKHIKSIPIGGDSNKVIKKWLYELEIPFKKYVIVDLDRSGHAILMTWKMVIKYWEGLFFVDDIAVFDQSLNWCLYFFHEDYLYFGKDNTFDKEAEYEKTLWINELRNKKTTSKQRK